MGKEERRNELLAAARKVFAERGFHEAKVGDIASAASVAKGTFYLYFPDKKSIFVELLDAIFVRLSSAILRVDTDGDVEAQVKHNLRAILSVIIDDPHTLLVLFRHTRGVDPEVSARTDAFFGGLKQLLVESLQEGQELGIVAPGQANLYASFTIGALKEILVEATSMPTGYRSRERIVDAVFGLLEAGYLRLREPADTRRPPDPEG